MTTNILLFVLGTGFGACLTWFVQAAIDAARAARTAEEHRWHSQMASGTMRKPTDEPTELDQ